MIMTGRCKICKSKHAKEISQMMIDGVEYSEIIKKFPDIPLYKQIISHHRNHFTDELTLTEVSDHEFVDRLKKLANGYIEKGLEGKELSMTQTRLIQTAANAIAFRKQIQDKSDIESSLETLVKDASRSQWKYETV